VTDKTLANAERKRDSLAAEIISLAQRTEELKRDIAKINDWIYRVGMNLRARMMRLRPRQKAMNLRRRQHAQPVAEATQQRKRLRLRLKN
jgi:hypothetical protein